MSTITDKFNKAGDGSANYPTAASVAATRNAGDSLLSCDSLAGWALDTPVHFSTYRITSDGEVDPSTQTDWKAIVSGNTLTQMTRIAGALDSGNLIGDKVELNPTIGWLSDLVSGLLKAHTQAGDLKPEAVASAMTPDAVADNLTPEAVAAQFADTADTALNGTILPWHINFPALGAVSASSASPLALTNSSQNILSVDISGFPDGSLLECSGLVFASGTATETGLFADIDGTLEAGQVGSWVRTLTIAGRVVTKTAGKTSIELRARKDNNTALTAGARQLLVKRIG